MTLTWWVVILAPVVLFLLVFALSRTVRMMLREIFGYPLRSSEIRHMPGGDVEVKRSERRVR